MAWKIQLPTGEYLDSVPDISFELNNQVFSSSSTDVLPGSFSFPATIELSDRNKTLLGNPQNVNNAEAWEKFEGCWVYCYNHALFFGTLTISNCTSRKATVNLVANPMSKIKESYLADMDLGGDRAFPSVLTTHMKAVAIAPSDYDYAFLPMLIFSRIHEPGGPEFKAHNYYDTATSSFHPDSFVYTPSVRLDYLLSRIITIEDTGYAFVNGWQTELETKRLYVFSNRDIRESDTLADPAFPATFNLKDFLPKVKTLDALKSVIGLFALGLFTNPFNKTIKLQAVANLLKKDAKHNWTAYAIDDVAIEQDNNAPNYYTFEGEPDTVTSADIPQEWPLAEDCIFVETEEKFNLLYNNSGSVGLFFYVETKMWIIYVAGYSGAIYGAVRYCHRALVLDPAKDKPYSLSYTPVFSSGNFGSVSKWIPDPDVVGNWIFDYHELNTIGLIPYRGMIDGVSGPTTSQSGWKPLAVPARMDIAENGVNVIESKYSMNWYGDYGLYNQWHYQWNEMLRKGKTVSQSFLVPVQVLTKFSFEDKVIVGGMEFFLKRLRIKKAAGKGMLLIEVSMISII